MKYKNEELALWADAIAEEVANRKRAARLNYITAILAGSAFAVVLLVLVSIVLGGA